MTEKNVEIKITKFNEFRYFEISIFDLEDAREIVNLLKAEPAVNFAKQLKLTKRDEGENYYLKITIFGTSAEYFLQLKDYKKFFTLDEPFSFRNSKKFRSILNYLFKIMTPQQKIKLAYWLESVD